MSLLGMVFPFLVVMSRVALCVRVLTAKRRVPAGTLVPGVVCGEYDRVQEPKYLLSTEHCACACGPYGLKVRRRDAELPLTWYWVCEEFHNLSLHFRKLWIGLQTSEVHQVIEVCSISNYR